MAEIEAGPAQADEEFLFVRPQLYPKQDRGINEAGEFLPLEDSRYERSQFPLLPQIIRSHFLQ